MAASLTIYGFITDTLFWKKQVVDFTKAIDTGLGYLDDILINYFHQIATIHDPRGIRLDVLGVTPGGEISLVFDSSKIDEALNPFSNISDEEIVNLFNIVEKCLYTQNRSEIELNDELKTQEIYNTSYIVDTVHRSATYTMATIPGIRSELKIYDFIEFEMMLNTVQVHFKFWINSTHFKANYPLTTITAVIPPCEPTLQTDVVSAVIASSGSIFSNINTGTTDVDHTGTLAYRTKYVVSSQSTPSIQFGLMYQGATPTSLESRAAIREYLLSLGIAQDALWEAKFPDIFVTAQFFLIPQWNNYTERPNNKYGNVYHGIINYSDLYKSTNRIFPSLGNEWIESHLEVITNPFNPILLTAIADPLNEGERFSIRNILTTYQAFGPDDTNYDYQEANAKNFSRYLGQAMAILYGDDVLSTSGFIENTFYDRRYLSFTCDQVEYHVLYREDFMLASEE